MYQRLDLGDRVAIEPAPHTSVHGFAGDTIVQRALAALDAPHGERDQGLLDGDRGSGPGREPHGRYPPVAPRQRRGRQQGDGPEPRAGRPGPDATPGEGDIAIA